MSNCTENSLINTVPANLSVESQIRIKISTAQLDDDPWHLSNVHVQVNLSSHREIRVGEIGSSVASKVFGSCTDDAPISQGDKVLSMRNLCTSHLQVFAKYTCRHQAEK